MKRMWLCFCVLALGSAFADSTSYPATADTGTDFSAIEPAFTADPAAYISQDVFFEDDGATQTSEPGFLTVSDGRMASVIVTPAALMPEPSSIVLFVIGGVALAGARARKRARI